MWWSYSTHRAMRLCQRKLVYEQKIASGTTSDPTRKAMFHLKQIQTLAEWQGSIVHQTLENCLTPRLRDRGSFCADDMIRYAGDLAIRQWDFSSRQRFREPSMVKTAHPEDYCALDAHEVGAPPLTRSEALQGVDTFARGCFENFMGLSELMAWLRSGSSFVAEHQLTFPLGAATVRATPDLICRLPAGGLLIVDWKTVASETDDYSMQLYLYALAALRSERWADFDPKKIILCEANLFQGLTRQYAATSQKLADAEDFAYTSIREMTTLLTGISKADFQIEDYEIAEKATTCALCAFRARCKETREQEILPPLSGFDAAVVQSRRGRKADRDAAMPTLFLPSFLAEEVCE